MSTLQLRPRSAPEILDAAVQLLRHHFVPLITLSALTNAPWLVLGLLIAAKGPGWPIAPDAAAPRGSAVPDPQLEAMMRIVLLVSPLMLVWYSLTEGAMVSAAADAYMGRPVSPGAAIRRVLGRAGSVVGGLLLKVLILGAVMVAIVVGVTMLITPVVVMSGGNPVVPLVVAVILLPLPVALGAYVYARLFAVTASVMLEGRGAVGALARSRRVASGETRRILTVMTLVLVLFLAFWVTQSIAQMLLPKALVAITLISFLPGLLFLPMLELTTVLLFYDILSRKEGTDLEIMAQQLGANAT